MDFIHKSVLLNETIDNLNVKPGGIYVDGTLGGAGHSSELLKRVNGQARLIGIDRDNDALAASAKRLEPYKDNVTLVHATFAEIKRVLAELNVNGVDGVMLDLGVSSYQIDNPERGFSYMNDAPLNMKMDETQYLSAYNVVNEYSEKDIKRILYEYGEESRAPRIAQLITEERKIKPIETTGELADIIKRAIPARERQKGSNPCKKTFQAIRIEVNNELKTLAQALEDITDCLNVGGRLCVISFHSLEDRIVKQTIYKLEHPCTCPKDAPICVCGRVPKVKTVSKMIIPSEKETEENPRSKSAKLRCAEKL